MEFFSQTTYASMVNLVWGGGLLKRIYIPRTSFALAAIGTGVVNTLLTIVPMLIVMLVLGLQIRWSIFYIVVPILFLALFSLGFGLILSTLAVYFPDVAEMYQIVLTAWMYLTPIIYPEEILPGNIHFIISTFNPMYSLVKLFRIPIYYGRLPNLGEFLFPALLSIVVFFIGWLFFTYRSDEFAYRI